MAKIRQWSLLAAGLIVVVFAAGWFLAISPQHAHASSVRKQQVQQQQTNAGLKTQLQQLQQQQTQVPDEQTRLAKIATELPATPDLASYIRSLTTAAGKAVDLVSITPGTPTAVAKPTAAPAPSATASPAAGTTAAPAAAPSATAAPAGAAPSLQTISLNLQVTGDYFAIEQFLTKLEGLQRATLVTSVALAQGSPLLAAGAPAAPANDAWKTVGATISLTIFESAAPPTIVAPAAGGTAAAVPGAAPAPAATAAIS